MIAADLRCTVPLVVLGCLGILGLPLWAQSAAAGRTAQGAGSVSAGAAAPAGAKGQPAALGGGPKGQAGAPGGGKTTPGGATQHQSPGGTKQLEGGLSGTHQGVGPSGAPYKDPPVVQTDGGARPGLGRDPATGPRSEVVLPPAQPVGEREAGGTASAGAGAQLVVPDFGRYKADIAGTRAQVDQLRDLPGSQLEALQHANRQLENATAVFEKNEARMSSRQRALAVFQIETASNAVRTVLGASGQLPTAGVITRSQAVEASRAIAADLESFSRSLATGRKPHALKVVVRPGNAGRPASPLAVYVLPFGIFLYADTVEEPKLHYLIEVLKFAQPTSPAVGELEPGARYVVWVGPQHAARDMARMVRARAVPKYQTVNAATPGERAEVIFNESDQAGVR